MLTVAALTALVTLAGVALALALTDPTAARMERFGTTTTQALAKLAVEPLLEQNRLHLAVIGNRLAALPEIAGVASLSADQRTLATTGTLGQPQFSAPVTIDDSIVGYVRVALNAEAFRTANTPRTVALVIAAALAALAVAVGLAVAGAARRGDVAELLGRRPAWLGNRTGRPATEEDPAAGTEPDTPPPAADVPHYLLAVNLYNQLSLKGDQRDYELSLARELAEAVAEQNQAQVRALPGVGVLVDFVPGFPPAGEQPVGDQPAGEYEDRPHQVLCAAFALARLLHEESPFGRYRLGAHLILAAPDAELTPEDDAVADAALLSALAPDMTLAVSQPFAAALAPMDGMTARALVNPLLDQLGSSSPDCHLITALEEPYAAMATEQAEQLEAQREATSSPSTF